MSFTFAPGGKEFGLMFECGPTSEAEAGALFDRLAKEMTRSLLCSLTDLARPLLTEHGGKIECVINVVPCVAVEVEVRGE